MFRLTRSHYCAKAFEALGLSHGGQWSQADIKAAYLRKAKECHPDAGGDAATFRCVTEAYGRLRTRSHRYQAVDLSGRMRQEEHVDTEHYPGMRTHAPHRATDMWTERKRAGEDETYRYPNRSTRSFYRPYTSHPEETGFTAAEIREAQSRTRYAITYQLLKYAFLLVVFGYIVVGLFRKNRIHEAIEARGAGYADKTYFERRNQDQQEGKRSALTTSVSVAEYQRQSDEKLRIMREGAQSESTRDKRGAMETRQKPMTVAVSFRGRPFTPEGLASCRKGAPSPVTLLDAESDVGCDLDDV